LGELSKILEGRILGFTVLGLVPSLLASL